MASNGPLADDRRATEEYDRWLFLDVVSKMCFYLEHESLFFVSLTCSPRKLIIKGRIASKYCHLKRRLLVTLPVNRQRPVHCGKSLRKCLIVQRKCCVGTSSLLCVGNKLGYGGTEKRKCSVLLLLFLLLVRPYTRVCLATDECLKVSLFTYRGRNTVEENLTEPLTYIGKLKTHDLTFTYTYLH